MLQIIKKVFFIGLIIVLSGCTVLLENPDTSSSIDNSKLLVAVLLPTSDNNNEVSQAIINTINLAYTQHNNPNVVYKIYDLPIDSSGAGDVAKLAIKDGAKIILGPVVAKNTQDVLKVADQYSIPVISFSNDITLLNQSANVFLASNTVSTDVEKIIEYANVTRKDKRFAILAPKDKYGDLVVATAKESLAARNLKLVKIVRYPEDKIALSAYVSKLVPTKEKKRINQIQAKLSKNEEVFDANGKLLTKAPLPKLDFDALILGDYGKRLIIVSTHLPLVDVDYKHIDILGNSNWNVKSIGKEAVLQGAYFPNYLPVEATDFANDFKKLYGYSPNFLSANIYNIVTLISSLVYYDEDKNLVILSTPEALSKAGANLKNSISGKFMLRKDGIFVNSMVVSQVFNGAAVSVENSDSVDFLKVPNYRILNGGEDPSEDDYFAEDDSDELDNTDDSVKFANSASQAEVKK